TLSSWANSSVEEVASKWPGILFFHLYLVRRAEKAGFQTIALAVDIPMLVCRESDINNRFTLLPNLTFKNDSAENEVE
ncbi:unnamed protein product, partial [Thlaspi arvense]